mmetsp:Transcript_4723/g.14414  ORF Transcript_4723/g.14414 Transcript_4723/m.14414 type:complete len:458 (-) Transcript_4723:12266-13639(-)
MAIVGSRRPPAAVDTRAVRMRLDTPKMEHPSVRPRPRPSARSIHLLAARLTGELRWVRVHRRSAAPRACAKLRLWNSVCTNAGPCAAPCVECEPSISARTSSMRCCRRRLSFSCRSRSCFSRSDMTACPSTAMPPSPPVLPRSSHGRFSPLAARFCRLLANSSCSRSPSLWRSLRTLASRASILLRSMAANSWCSTSTTARKRSGEALRVRMRPSRRRTPPGLPESSSISPALRASMAATSCACAARSSASLAAALDASAVAMARAKAADCRARSASISCACISRHSRVASSSMPLCAISAKAASFCLRSSASLMSASPSTAPACDDSRARLCSSCSCFLRRRRASLASRSLSMAAFLDTSSCSSCRSFASCCAIICSRSSLDMFSDPLATSLAISRFLRSSSAARAAAMVRSCSWCSRSSRASSSSIRRRSSSCRASSSFLRSSCSRTMRAISSSI